MSELWTWLLGLGVVGLLIRQWFVEQRQREETNKMFNVVLENKIEDRQAAIEEANRKQAETLNEYYAKKAKYHNNLLRDPNRNTPDEGKE